MLQRFRTFYNHHRPHRALRGDTPAEAMAAATDARPASRPIPTPAFVSHHTVGRNSGNLFARPYKINVGLRWAGDECTSIRDGDHITIFSGNRLVRELTADPTRNYQAGDKTTRTYRNREPHPAP